MRTHIEEAEKVTGRKAKFQDFEVNTWITSLLGKQCSAAKFSAAIHLLQRFSRQIGQFFEDYDVLLTPTIAMPPAKTGIFQLKGTQALAAKLLSRLNSARLVSSFIEIDSLSNKVFEFIPYGPPFNISGQPAMSVPLYWNNEGLPIGMQFVGHYGDEATLFRLAGQLEKARPWYNRIPPICNNLD